MCSAAATTAFYKETEEKNMNVCFLLAGTALGLLLSYEVQKKSTKSQFNSLLLDFFDHHKYS